jgi:hypothetical protein
LRIRIRIRNTEKDVLTGLGRWFLAAVMLHEVLHLMIPAFGIPLMKVEA